MVTNWSRHAHHWLSDACTSSGRYQSCKGVQPWEGESIPTIFKGIVKIPPMLAKRNIGAGLRTVIPL